MLSVRRITRLVQGSIGGRRGRTTAFGLCAGLKPAIELATRRLPVPAKLRASAPRAWRSSGRTSRDDRKRGSAITPSGAGARVLAVASDHANGAAGDVRSRGLDAIAGWRARLLEPSRKAAELTPPAFARVRCPSKRRPDCCGRLGTARAEPGAGHGGTIGIATDSWRTIWRSKRRSSSPIPTNSRRNSAQPCSWATSWGRSSLVSRRRPARAKRSVTIGAVNSQPTVADA